MAEKLLSDDKPNTIQASERDLWLIRSALQAYLATFGHDEGEIVEEIKALLQRLRPVDAPAPTPSEFRFLW